MLTKQKAFELSGKLWRWLAENPGKYKCKWPEWSKYEEIDADCFICQYRTEQKLTCEECIAQKLWREGNGDKECLNLSSPYRKWTDAMELKDFASCAKYAKEIAVWFENAAKEGK